MCVNDSVMELLLATVYSDRQGERQREAERERERERERCLGSPLEEIATEGARLGGAP